jgi:type I restriction enzyme S subunit
LALELAERERELLREFQARLTTDVVTGQLDVREVAARLPQLASTDVVSDMDMHEVDDLDAEASEYVEASNG